MIIGLNIPTQVGNQTVAVETGKPVFILGGNGTGKSALITQIAGQIPSDKLAYIPGSRPNYFDSESLSVTPASRRQMESQRMSYDRSPDMRWRALTGTSRNERVLHDLNSAEAQYKIDAANDIAQNGASSSFIAILQNNSSPVDSVNRILQQANLPIKLIVSSGELTSSRNGAIYSIARMSDGERAAVIMSSDVKTANPGAVFVIDEPELHLHRAIVVPLIGTLIAERPDCAFVICTHELDLPNISINSLILLVRSCTWNGQSVSSWEIDTIFSSDEIPEDIKVDIIGSRRKVLFIEGTNLSLDQPMYAILFPNISVRYKEGCKDVYRAVAGLKSIQDKHHTAAYGLVDGDGIPPEVVEKWQTENVFALPVFSVESLYYGVEMVNAISVVQGLAFGIDPNQLAQETITNALHSLTPENIKHLASRIAEKKIRETLLGALPTRTELVSQAGDTISVTVPCSFTDEVTRIEGYIASRQLFDIIDRYPIRESGILRAISDGLKFRNRGDYENVVLTRLRLDSTLQTKLKARLAPLSGYLM